MAFFVQLNLQKGVSMDFPKWLNWRRFAALLVVALAVGLAIGGVGTAQARGMWKTITGTTTNGNGGSPGHQPVGICHHTGNSQAHEWVYITPDASGVWNGHAKGGHQDFYGPEDIIPAFTFTDSHGVTHSFPGQNLDTHYGASLEPNPNGQFTGDEILANKCEAPSGTTTSTTGTTETTTTTSTTPGHGHMKIKKSTKGGDFVPGTFSFTLSCTDTAGHIESTDVTLSTPFFEWEAVSCADGQPVTFIEHHADGWQCQGTPNPANASECIYTTVMVAGGVTWCITNEKVSTTTTSTTSTVTTTVPTTTTVTTTVPTTTTVTTTVPTTTTVTTTVPTTTTTPKPPKKHHRHHKKHHHPRVPKKPHHKKHHHGTAYTLGKKKVRQGILRTLQNKMLYALRR